MVRSIGLGALALVLSLAGAVLWSLLFRANLGTAPDVPWAAVVMLGLMVCTWRLLSRTTLLRSLLPGRRHATWACTGALAVTACLVSLVILGLRLGHVDKDAFVSSIDMNALSIPTRIIRVVMASSVAAFFEEVGFRGLIQQRLEQRYGPRRAIAATGLLFYLMHAGHGWTRGDIVTVLAVAVPIIVGSILLGTLAIASNSLGPSIVAHALMDTVLLPIEWTGKHNVEPIASTGIDVHFGLWALVFAISGTVTLKALVHLASGVYERRTASEPARVARDDCA
jgi:membrane protease YdiL (CAAX protease family)